MAPAKLIRVLRTLNKEQWQGLRQYILSQSSKESDNGRLFLLLYACKNEIRQMDNLDPFRMEHFPHMSKKVFQNMLSRVFQMTEQWCVHYQLSQEKYQSDLLLVKFYNRKGLYQLADQVAHRMEKRIDSSQGWDLENSRARAELQHQQYYSDNPIKYRQGAAILENLVNTYLEQFKNQALLYACELHNWGRIQKYDYSQMLNQIAFATKYIHSNTLSRQLDYLRLVINKLDALSIAKLADKLFSKQFDPKSDLHVIITVYLINYSIKLWLEGKLLDPSLISKLYEHGLYSGVLLLEDAKIPQSRFNKMCILVSTTRSFEWSNNFIDSWISIVKTKDLNSTRSIVKAQNCMYHNREEEILEYTRSVRYENESARLKVGVLNIISLYKTRSEDLPQLVNAIKNFKVILRRSKKSISNSYYKGLVNLVKVIELLIKQDHKIIKIDLSEFQPLQYKTWVKIQLG